MDCQNYEIPSQYEPANRRVLARMQLRTLSCQIMYRREGDVMAFVDIMALIFSLLDGEF